MPRRTTGWQVTEGRQTPVQFVAIRMLRTRLDTVWSGVLATMADERDVEAVHRLRVAIRRALAGLEAFDDLLPPKRRAWIVKRLRRLRRAAGEARDLDVLALRLAGGRTEGLEGRGVAVSSQGRRARERLVAMLVRQRAASRRPIRALYEDLLESDWTGRVEALLERVSAGGRSMVFGEYAARRFKPLMARFFELADHKLRNADEIHGLRIEGKKLRYALEIFASVFPPTTLARCREALERLQQKLGEFTDHAAAAERLRCWSRQDGVGADGEALAALCREESSRAREARKLFVRWWSPARRRGLRRTFENSLRRVTA